MLYASKTLGASARRNRSALLHGSDCICATAHFPRFAKRRTHIHRCGRNLGTRSLKCAMGERTELCRAERGAHRPWQRHP